MKLHTPFLLASCLAISALTPGLSAQESGNPNNTTKKDPFVASGQPAPEAAGAPTRQFLSILHEEFSLDLATAAELQRKNLGDAALYEVLLEQVSKKTAKLESLTSIRTLSGQKATAESILELMYPTEFEPAELPNTVGVSISPEKPGANPDGSQPPAPPAVPNTGALERAVTPSSLEGLRTPATGTAFETRNVGRTIEVEPTLKPSGIIELRFSCDHVVHVGTSKYGQGVSEVTMPEFETRRLTNAFELTAGKPAMIGTVNRTPESKVDADSANRIWFAFVTVDFVKP
jgi:hypothetical protein